MQDHDIPDEEISATVSLFERATGFMASQAIYVAAKLDVAGVLEDGPKELDALADACQANAEALYRLLRALTSIGLFSEIEPKCFAMTPSAMPLLRDVPMSLRPYLLLLGDPAWWNSWGDLDVSIKTGSASFDRLFHMDFSEYLEIHPELSHHFNQCMSSLSQSHNSAILQSYDFCPFSHIVDVGGGQGALLLSILQANPESQGTVFDLPHVIESHPAPPSHMASRLHYEAGDFFQQVPMGADLYILKQIIHDWSDADAVRILQHCKTAMPTDSRLLIIDTAIDAENVSSINYFFDLHMQVTAPGAKERTRDEFEELLTIAGFRKSRCILTPASLCLLEAIPQ